MHPSTAQYNNGYERPPLRAAQAIPPGAQPPRNPSQRQFSPQPAPYAYDFEQSQAMTSPLGFYTPQIQVQESPSFPDLPPRPRSMTESGVEPRYGSTAPEFELYRSSSQQSRSKQPLIRRPEAGGNKGTLGINLSHNDHSTLSFASEEYYSPEDYPAEPSDDLPRELSNLSISSEEALRRFQAGELPESDRQWHRLVPFEAREALGKQEVQRQSVLFEIFTSEKEYVADLEAVREVVYIDPLRNASPPIIAEDHLQSFISDVFWNMDKILEYHRRMLADFFERQREQHPLVQSVADIVLDAVLIFRDEYESYIKHYPIAEALHRAEIKRNQRYQAFIRQCSQDPRIRKRDLLTFLSRPVSRLPRFSLVLEHILKLTDPEHPDCETLPLILNILSEFIKSTQPGIAVSESKVKLWDLSESLVYVKGEIIDMDLYDESRTLVHMGTLARRQRAEGDWYGWSDLTVALLDHYLILTREEIRPNGVIKRHVVSRPLPLEYIRLGSFDIPTENRKGRADDGRLLESLRPNSWPMYPFTVYHASSKSHRHYTLYAASENSRKKWQEALVDAIGVHQVRAESNMYYEPQILSTSRVSFSVNSQQIGKVTSCVPFNSAGKSFLAIGCLSGIFVAIYGQENFRKVLNLPNPTHMVALEKFNKFVIHHDSNLLSYSIDILARVALGHSQTQTLDATQEKIAGQEAHISLFRAGCMGNRTLIIYAQKSFLQTTLHALEAFHPSNLHLTPTRSRTLSNDNVYRSFRTFGNSFYVPKEPSDIIPLVKTIAITTEKGIVVVDPTNLARNAAPIVPDFSLASSNPAMAQLKSHCETAKPLGLVRSDKSEFMVIYDVMGCYITRQGIPDRSCGYIRWETKATSYAHYGLHILLFSSQFIEVRHVSTGRLEQVIEGNDIRLLYGSSLLSKGFRIIAVMAGEKDRDTVPEKIFELQDTSLITHRPAAATNPVSPGEGLWDEWDM